MKVLTNLKFMKNEPGPIVLAAGFFDGVHRGHKKVIESAVSKARKLGGKAWVMTFDPHPLNVLKPDSAPLLLTSNRHKLELLAQLGVDGCLLMSFTRRLAATKAEDFVVLLRRFIPVLAEMLIGHNWRFGRHGKGNPDLLRELGHELGIGVTVIGPATWKSKPISSTRIRAEIMRGNLRSAAALLGRPFGVLGTVVHGRAIGRKLGFPTANLNPHSELLPPNGVYAVRARVEGVMRNGVVSLGVRPTFAGRRVAPVLELYLFNFSRNLYGRDIEVFFVKKLRDERQFPSVEALAEQIGKDAAQARKLLARRHLRA